MKYIKKFEDFENKIIPGVNVYWKVRTDSPYYEISLEKIGMNDDEIENFLEMRPDFNDSVVYIELCWEGIGSNYYWADSVISFIDDDPKYLGEVEIVPEEIEGRKYNL